MLYRDAGVDIDTNNRLKKTIGRLARSTFTPRVVSDFGMFGSLFALKGFKNPLLVASCDGVGTKLTVAKMMSKHDTVGIDLVNHCVNDILTLGARPLFFLDYIATSYLTPKTIQEMVSGLARACRKHNCPLVGGETAIMPGWFRRDDCDLVGFIIGLVERGKIIDPQRLKPGDILIGIPSSGLHTNGFSLARKVLFQKAKLTVKSRVKGIARPLGLELLQPHRSYFFSVYPLLTRVKAIAHITGGGLFDNIERLLPAEVSCIITKKSWRPKRIFKLIQELGDVPTDEMYRTFNMGIGMVLFVAPRNVNAVLAGIRGTRVVGKVVRGTFGVSII